MWQRAETHFHHTLKNRLTENTYSTYEHAHRHHILYILTRTDTQCNEMHTNPRILSLHRQRHIASAAHKRNGESAATASSVVAQSMSTVNTYWHCNQHRGNHTCTHWVKCGLRQSPWSCYKYKRNMAVALSESLISTAPRVFKDRSVGNGEETWAKTLWPLRAVLKMSLMCCCWFSRLCFAT